MGGTERESCPALLLRDRQPFPLFEVPENALARMLQLADDATRASCVCTCRKLRSISLLEQTIAAVFKGGQQHMADSLVEWLSKYGAVVTHLDITVVVEPWMYNPGYEQIRRENSLIIQLPCQVLTQLQSLSLTLCEWHQPYQQDSSTGINSVGSNSGGQQTPIKPSNPLLHLQQLTKLSLYSCTTLDDDHFVNLSCVAVLTNLRHLELQAVDSSYLQGHGWFPHIEYSPADYTRTLSQALAHLTQLTCLILSSPSHDLVMRVLLNSISSMHQLAQLGIGCEEDVAAGLAGIPTSVSNLRLHCSGLSVTALGPPRLTQLTSLRHLHLGSLQAFNPAILTVYTQLQHLIVEDACPLPRLPFLEAISQLQQLQHLAVPYTFTRNSEPALDVSWYTALVASSRLTHLDLQADRPDSFPEGIGQLLFHHPHGLPNLRVLKLGWSSSSSYVQHFGEQLTELPWQLSTAELQLMVDCCPALEELQIANAVMTGRPGEGRRAFATLHQLKGLTQLSVGGIVVDDAIVTDVVAEMKQLKALEILLAPALGWSGLYELTRLHRLRELHVQYCSLFPASQASSDADSQQCLPDEWDQGLPNWLTEQAGDVEFDNMSQCSGLSSHNFRAAVANGGTFRLAADHSSVRPQDSLSEDDVDAAESESFHGSQLQDGTDTSEDGGAEQQGWAVSDTCRMEYAEEQDIYDSFEVLITSEAYPPDVDSQLARFCMQNNRYAMFASGSPSMALPSRVFRRKAYQLLPIEDLQGAEVLPVWDL